LHNLLAKTRSINKVLQKSAGYPVDFKEISAILSEIIECSVYILDRRGKVLGFSYLKGFECEITRSIVESPTGFPPEYNENVLRINETYANYCNPHDTCDLNHEIKCYFNKKMITTIVPIVGTGTRLGSLVLARFDRNFEDEDLILSELGATVIGMEILRARQDRMEEEARKRAAVQIAVGTLSYSELDAVHHIFEQLDGDEGLLVASKIADRVGITRSVIVNALRKFESAGVIESKSLGMKGTFIKVLNDRLLEELERLKEH